LAKERRAAGLLAFQNGATVAELEKIDDELRELNAGVVPGL
jgi:hypothetical protein